MKFSFPIPLICRPISKHHLVRKDDSIKKYDVEFRGHPVADRYKTREQGEHLSSLSVRIKRCQWIVVGEEVPPSAPVLACGPFSHVPYPWAMQIWIYEFFQDISWSDFDQKISKTSQRERTKFKKNIKKNKLYFDTFNPSRFFLMNKTHLLLFR
jgi:hypothetical protein